MKYIVKKETAAALKSAGFPQPAPEEGQWWYDTYGNETLVSEIERPLDQDIIELFIPGSPYPYEATDLAGFTYAPTVNDIMALLPETCVLEKCGGGPSCKNNDEEFPVLEYGDTYVEAAAQVWLYLKKTAPALNFSEAGA